MRKWLTIVFTTLVLGIAIIIPTKADAWENPVVQITVYAYIVGSPSGLTLTYVSDSQIDIAWTKGIDAENTMVRVQYGEIPMDRTKGYQVYYGVGENVTDSNADLTNPRIAYYRAWSQKADGRWEPLGVSGEANFMSTSYLWIGLIVLALGISSLSYVFKQMVLSVLSAGAWIMLAIFAYYNLNTGVLANMGLVIFFVLCFLAMLVTTYKLSGKPKEVVVPYDHRAHLKENVERYRAVRRRL